MFRRLSDHGRSSGATSVEFPSRARARAREKRYRGDRLRGGGASRVSAFTAPAAAWASAWSPERRAAAQRDRCPRPAPRRGRRSPARGRWVRVPAGVPVHPCRPHTAATGLAGRHQIDPHPKVRRTSLPGSPSRSTPAGSASDRAGRRVDRAPRAPPGRPLERHDVGLVRRRPGIEHNLVGRSQCSCATYYVASAQRRPFPAAKPARRASTGSAPSPARARSVRTRDHPEPATRRGAARDLEAGTPAHRPVPRRRIQTHTREDRDSVPCRLAVNRDGIPAVSELVAEQVEERIVGELGLLQADHVRQPLSSDGGRRATRC